MAGRYRAERPMGLQDISDGLLIKSGTLGAQRNRGSERRARGEELPSDIPPEDGNIGDRCPWWYESTLVKWVRRAGFVPPDTPKTWDAVCGQVRAQGGVGKWQEGS